MPRDILVIYMSRAARLLDAPDLDLLVATSARKNAKRKITGLLIKSGNYFLQFLEGPAVPVQEVLDRIALDVRHRDMRILYRDRCEKRVFAQWSMGSINLDDQYAVDLASFRRLREQVQEIVTAERADKDAVVKIIAEFVTLMREHKVAA